MQIHAHRGASVTRMTLEETIELFAVTAQLEAMGAGLQAMHEQLLDWYAQGKRHEYFDLNHRIHRAVVVLSGDGILAETHARLIARARRSRYQAILDDTRWAESVGEHGRFMDALARRDAADAAAIWRKHVLGTGDVVARRKAARGEPAPVRTAHRASQMEKT